MGKNNSVMKTMVAMLGVSVGVGCNADSSRPVGSGSGAPIDSVVTARSALLAPGRPHDISNADLDGTVQFRVLAAPADKMEQLINSAVYYKSAKGMTIETVSEVTAIKATKSFIATVRSIKPLDVNEWYSLEVVPGRNVEVDDAERTGADGVWRMRLFTGPNPQVVAVKTDGAHISISFSEPVNLRDLNLTLASKGNPVAGCFETWAGCVSTLDPSSEVLGEEISFKLATGTIHEDLELKMNAARTNSIAALQLQQGSWKVAADGARTWRLPVAN